MFIMVTIMLFLIDVSCGYLILAYCCLLLEVVGWYATLDDDWYICCVLLLI